MPTGRRARILMVDDDEAVRTVLGRALVEDGYEAVGVADRRDAVVATGLERFDLVITNVSMPGLTGEQMAAELRRRFPGLLSCIWTTCPTRSGPSFPRKSAPSPSRSAWRGCWPQLPTFSKKGVTAATVPDGRAVLYCEPSFSRLACLCRSIPTMSSIEELLRRIEATKEQTRALEEMVQSFS